MVEFFLSNVRFDEPGTSKELLLHLFIAVFTAGVLGDGIAIEEFSWAEFTGVFPQLQVDAFHVVGDGSAVGR